MSTFKVTVERLNIHEHTNADALELAQVGLFRSIVGKGVYKTGDLAVFIPEQGILPDWLIDKLGLTGKLSGPDHNRVKAVKLRGELSQGVIAPVSVLPDTIDPVEAFESRMDVSKELGVVKWVPEVPVSMSGEAYGVSDIMKWVDIENIKRFPDIFSEGEEVTATEKIHGTCTVASYDVVEDVLHVSSKGLTEKNIAISESDSNLYWRAVKGHGVLDMMKAIVERFSAVAVGVYGETYGKGVQDLGYGVEPKKEGEAPAYAMFDIRIKNASGEVFWVDFDETQYIAQEFNIPVVPVLYRGPYNEDVISEHAEGKETISGKGTNVREGVVVRPVRERHSDVTGSRAIGKWVSEGYLTRKNGTEYE